MSVNSGKGALHQLAAFYRSIYFYVSLFSLVYCLLVYQARVRIYQMELTWGRISLVYFGAACLAAMLTLVAYYAWVAASRVWKRHRLAKRRTRILCPSAGKMKKKRPMGLSSN